MKKLFEKLPSFFYPIVWLLAIGAFTALIVFMYIERDIAKYISALAILLSAFLAALSVLKSIQNSRQSEINNALSKKKTNLLYIDFILLDIYQQIESLRSEFDHMMIYHEQLQNLEKGEGDTNLINTISKNQRDKSTLRNKKIITTDQVYDFFIKTLIERNTFLTNRKIQIEDKEILSILDEGQRICLFEISVNLGLIDSSLSHLKSSYDANLMSNHIATSKSIFEVINHLIKIFKDDIQKEYPELCILSMDDYNKFHKKEAHA